MLLRDGVSLALCSDAGSEHLICILDTAINARKTGRDLVASYYMLLDEVRIYLL